MSWRLHDILELRTSGLQLNVAAMTGTCQGPWAHCSSQFDNVDFQDEVVQRLIVRFVRIAEI